MNAEKPVNILFLCTHNSARSILAEAAMNHLGQGRIQAFSAGSSPRENKQPHPLALKALQAAGISTAGLSSKAWDVFAAPEAPQMDLVVTVCDSAAGEVCPFWPGHPAKAHWGYADPSQAPGSEADKLAAFSQTLDAIQKRLQAFMALPWDKLDPAEREAAARSLVRA